MSEGVIKDNNESVKGKDEEEEGSKGRQAGGRTGEKLPTKRLKKRKVSFFEPSVRADGGVKFGPQNCSEEKMRFTIERRGGTPSSSLGAKHAAAAAHPPSLHHFFFTECWLGCDETD